MYDYIDRPMGLLDQGSRFLVWAMRGWAHNMAVERNPAVALEAVFARQELADALPHFHLAMTALNRDSLTKLAFNAMSCAHVSEAEAILLSVVRLLTIGKHKDAVATIELLVKDEAAVILTRALTAVAIVIVARYGQEALGAPPTQGN